MPEFLHTLEVDTVKFGLKKEKDEVSEFVRKRLGKKCPGKGEFECAILGLTHTDSQIPVSVTIKDVIPKGFMPRQGVKILTDVTKFPKPMKYIGNGHISSRELDFSIKFYENGYFYHKQAILGGDPWWTFYEGAWSRKGNCITMNYHLKYCLGVKKEDKEDIRVQCVKHQGIVSFSKDEKELSGQFVASLGTEEITWQTLYRCNVTVAASRTNINTRKDSDLDSDSDSESVNFDEPPAQSNATFKSDSTTYSGGVAGGGYTPAKTSLEQSFLYKTIVPYLRYGAALPVLWAISPYIEAFHVVLVLIVATVVIFQGHFQ